MGKEVEESLKATAFAGLVKGKGMIGLEFAPSVKVTGMSGIKSVYGSYAIEPIKYILANNLDFCQGNVVKYVTRFREKGGTEDLLKAITYIKILIEEEHGRKSKQEERE